MTLAQIQSPAGFIAGDVFPIIPVDFVSDKYYTYDPNVFARDDVRPRGPRDTVARIGFTTSQDQYTCVNKAIGTDIPDQVRNNADPAIDATLQQTASDLLAAQWRQHLERQWASNFFTTGIYGASAVGGLGLGTEVSGTASTPTPGTTIRHWSDQTNSTPIDDIRAAIRTFQKNSAGIKPNRLVLAAEVADALVDHPDIIDRVKYTEGALNDPQMFLTGMARLFGIERIVVADAVKATNAEGVTATYDFIQGPHALLAYRPASPSLMTPMTGAIFMHRNNLGSGMAMPTKMWRDEATASDVYESEAAFDIKICSKSLGYFFYNAIA
ncbi:MAG: major capsid protein [Gemmatimonadaceae bacterium]|nr:major capsid protein [Gemmatimonadaceae bacterium]